MKISSFVCRESVLAVSLLLLGALSNAASAAEPTKQSDYYTTYTLAIPESLMIEAGASELLPDGRVAVSSRRGDIFIVENAFTKDPAGSPAVFKKFASGLHEVLGIAYRDGALYAVQRGEVTRLKDEDGDGRADLYETVADGWEINGDYHEYAFGSKFDNEGNMWIVLCLTGSFSSNCKYRGWCLRVSPDGKVTPTCSGIRSPGGIGANAIGDMFYTDNQGPWNGTCGLKYLKPGAFEGHPGGNAWYKVTNNAIGAQPPNPASESRMMTEAKKIPELMPTAVYFPYDKMGKSAAGIACDTTGGKFGPFEKQLFVADQSFSTVMRVHLEKVGDRYQGACFPFLDGFASGSLSLMFTPDGSLFVGGTNRGWGSRGPAPHSLERVAWTSKTPFEIHEMRAKPYGFELTFTQPIDVKSAADLASYKLETYTYIYQSKYGSPEVDRTNPKITKAEVANDGKSVQLHIDGLREGHVHELHASGIRNSEGLPLWHDRAYYTLNYLQ